MEAYHELLLQHPVTAEDGCNDFAAALQRMWIEEYVDATDHPTNTLAVDLDEFRYIIDAWDLLVAGGEVEEDGVTESRLVAVLGNSCAPRRTRGFEDARLRGWPMYPDDDPSQLYDRGHFIAHSMGGAVDGVELNVFRQRRDLNRGWSEEGKEYRKMEAYCAANPGVFCFSRPIYAGRNAFPSVLEFGVLKQDGSLWCRRFSNQYG